MRVAKVDVNQATIVAALRDVGASVFPTHAVGNGFPDLVVGFRGNTFLLEVKSTPGTLTPEQKNFFSQWRGHVAVVREIDDALRAIGCDF